LDGGNGGNGGSQFPLKKESVREQMAEMVAVAAVAKQVARLLDIGCIIFMVIGYQLPQKSSTV
jgi:hypothetical protein